MPTRRAAPTADSLSWQYDIPLITNRYILWDMLRVIALCDSWHVVIRLYCPPDVFDQAVAHVQHHTGESKV